MKQDDFDDFSFADMVPVKTGPSRGSIPGNKGTKTPYGKVKEPGKVRAYYISDVLEAEMRRVSALEGKSLSQFVRDALVLHVDRYWKEHRGGK